MSNSTGVSPADATAVALAESAAGRLQFSLSYGDCDVVGIAYFSIYYRWMERCYSLWLNAHGVRSGEMVDQLGVVTVGVSSGCEYRGTVHALETLHCQAVRQHIGGSSYRVGFEFARGGDVVTVGQMTFVCRQPDFSRGAIPDRLRDLIMSLPEPTHPMKG